LRKVVASKGEPATGTGDKGLEASVSRSAAARAASSKASLNLWRKAPEENRL